MKQRILKNRIVQRILKIFGYKIYQVTYKRRVYVKENQITEFLACEIERL